MSKGKSIHQTLLLRAIAIVLPLNIILLITVSLLLSATLSNSLEKDRQILGLYMKELDGEMFEATDHLYDLTSGIVFEKACQPSGPNSNEYEILRAQSQIVAMFQTWLTRQHMISGYFIQFLQPKDTTMLRSVDSSDLWLWHDVLKNPAYDFIDDSKWHLITLAGHNYLYILSNDGNTHYGAWINVEKVMSYLGLDAAGSVQPTTVIEFNTASGYLIPTADLTRALAEDHFLVYVDSAQAAISLCRPSGKINLFSLIPHTLLLLAAFSFLALLALPVLWHIIRMQVLKPLNQLLDGVMRTKNGEMDFRIASDGTNGEFEQLNQHFNAASDMIIQSRQAMYEAKIEEQRVRIRYLSQQVQPHFILNALNLLYCYDETQHQQMQQMIVCLSGYFRYVISAQTPYVRLAQEIEHIRNYLHMQQLRYPGRLTMDIYVDPQLNNLLIPPMIIQQFSENAIKHALPSCRQNELQLHIEVLPWPGSQARIVFSDTGCGFSVEALSQIHQMLKTGESTQLQGIGICNIIERLKLLYQDNASLTIENVASGGAKIVLCIPAKFSQKDGLDEETEE